jgi:hypothetical protein
VHSVFVLSVDGSDDLAGLVLLDQSAVLDAVDHDIQLQCTQMRFDNSDTVHEWFRSSLAGWTRDICVAVLRDSL